MSATDTIAPAEIWKPVPEFPGYIASSHGRLASIHTKGRREPLVEVQPGHYLKRQRTDRGGYMRASFVLNGKIEHRIVSRVILSAFVGPCPDGMEACHNDGCRTNNHIDNLRWDTKAGNHADKKRHGTLLFGGKHKMAKLTEADVRMIRWMRDEGWKLKHIAAHFRLNHTHVWDIVHRHAWSHM